jgi:hypothetical protein
LGKLDGSAVERMYHGIALVAVGRIQMRRDSNDQIGIYEQMALVSPAIPGKLGEVRLA